MTDSQFLHLDGAPQITEPDSANARTSYRTLNVDILNLADRIASLDPVPRAQFLARVVWAVEYLTSLKASAEGEPTHG